MKFTELDLPKYILDAMNSLGFEEATEIQEKSLSIIRAGEDMLGKSKTGSGKTFAYGIPAIEKIDTEDKSTQVLIVCPTRELAGQICDELRKITLFREGCRIVPIFGGSNMNRQIDALKGGAKVVVGTPGRLMDHLRRRTLKIHKLKMIVLDEADEMLDMGFKEDIETILKSTNKDHQTIMFSATMPKPILAISNNFMKTPKMIEVSSQNSALKIDQRYVSVGLKDKKQALSELFKKLKPRLSIVFSNTKKMVESIVDFLNTEGLNAMGLHGDMRQNERKKVMQQIKKVNIGKENEEVGQAILVATDVAARGIDINNVDIVFNFDIPNNTDYYTHRIGRTGRAGKSGIAYTIVNNSKQVKQLTEIAKETGAKITEEYCNISQKSRPEGKQANLKKSNDKRNSNNKNQRFSKPGNEKYNPNKEKGNFSRLNRTEKRTGYSNNENNLSKKRKSFSKEVDLKFLTEKEKKIVQRKPERFSKEEGSFYGERDRKPRERSFSSSAGESRFGDKKFNTGSSKNKRSFSTKSNSKFKKFKKN